MPGVLGALTVAVPFAGSVVAPPHSAVGVGVQPVAFDDVQFNVTLAFSATLAALIPSDTVGAGSGLTVSETVLLTLPPGPAHVKMYL